MPNGIIIQSKGTWMQGYRPTKARITVSCTPSGESMPLDVMVYDNDYNYWTTQNAALTSGTHQIEVTLGLSFYDLLLVYCLTDVETDQFAITNIEFLV